LMELELKKMFDTVISIQEEMFYLREREEEMQVLNKTTNNRMAWLSFLSLIVCLSVAGLQFESLSEILLMIMTLPINKYSILLGTTTCSWEKNGSINNKIISLKIIFKPRYCLEHCNPRVLQDF
ncbi:transmembrane emp24 domain-containing protein p24delta8, partial [Quercus suber]